MTTATTAFRKPATLITADACDHSGTNLQPLAHAGVPALIAENAMRQRK